MAVIPAVSTADGNNRCAGCILPIRYVMDGDGLIQQLTINVANLQSNTSSITNCQ